MNKKTLYKELLNEVVNEVKVFNIEKLSNEKRNEIIELWHTSRISETGRYNRMCYVKKWFIKKYPEYENKNKLVWFTIEDVID